MKLIRFLLRHSRANVLFAILAGAVSGIASTGLLALINALLANPAAHRSDLLKGFFALCALIPITRVIAELLLNFLGQNTILRLRLELSRRVLAVPLRRLEDLGPHKVLATLAEDVPTITNLVGIIPVLAINAAVLVGALVYLAWLSWQVFAAVIVFMVVGILAYQFPINRAVKHFRVARQLSDDLYNHFRALTQGIKELSLHFQRRQAFLDEELQGTARAFRDENIHGLRIYTLAASWGQVFVFLVVGLLLVVLPRMGATPQILTGFVLTLLYLMSPLQNLMNAAPNFGRANAALERVEAMGLQLANLTQPQATPQLAPSFWSDIRLDGVTHAYRLDHEDGEFVLGPIHLTLRPGELVFIAGGNGSGKTTLAKLLMGLYVPDSGRIFWNGAPVTDETRESYRQSFSAVFSDFFLFTNLLGLADPKLDSQADRYLEKLQLKHKVQVKDGKLSTLDLSQGQRKRLALLTAYLEDRPIYLFDEWAADQDPFFKEVFYRQLLPELKQRNKTVVVISHDDRYYDVADRLIKLESGKIVAETEPLESGRAEQIGVAD